MSAFLTEAEKQELTGYKVPKCQIRWLTQNGVRHWVAATGRPVVPRSAIDGSPNSTDDLPPAEPRYVA